MKVCPLSAAVPSGVTPCWMQMETSTWTTQWTWPAMWRSCSAGLWPTSGAVSSPEPEPDPVAHSQVFSISSIPVISTGPDYSHLHQSLWQIHITVHCSVSGLAVRWRSGREQPSRHPFITRPECVCRDSKLTIKNPPPLTVVSQDCRVELLWFIHGIFIHS